MPSIRALPVSISLASAMAIFEHTDDVEIAATITYSQGHPPLQPPTRNAVQLGPSSPVVDTSDTTTAKPNKLSTSESLGMFCDSHPSIDGLTLNRGHFQWMFPLPRSGDGLLRFLNDRTIRCNFKMQLLAKSVKDLRNVRLNPTYTNLHPRTW